ncbi:MAG: L-threonylcarbamoyladenylate synthase [Candidatus Omnitrophota bacterium]
MSSLKRTIVLKIDPCAPDKKVIVLGADILRRGGLVAFPTETVYGLAANIDDRSAMRRLSRVKERPANKPFTVLIAGISSINKMNCSVTKRVRRLLNKFWPGPLTVVLGSAGGKKIGFRMPANKVALDLIRASAVPAAVPSANLSGRRPPTTAANVLAQLDGKIDLVIDAGKTEVGIESTVVDMTGDVPVILREGAIPKELVFRTLANG